MPGPKVTVTSQLSCLTTGFTVGVGRIFPVVFSQVATEQYLPIPHSLVPRLKVKNNEGQVIFIV
jgi:hypothetical protein